jgi:hypothetical protein
MMTTDDFDDHGTGWPVAELDSVRRLHVLAESTPGVVYAEHLLPLPFEQTWPVIADLEHTLPLLLADVRSFTVTKSDGTPTEALARSPLGMRARFDISMRTGYCVMRSRFLVGGLAAIQEGEQTRLAFFGGLRLPGIRFADKLIHLLTRGTGDRAVRRLTEHLRTR